MNRRTSAGGRTLEARVMLAHGLVVTAGILTAALVAAVAGPPLFHQHLLEAGHAPNSPELKHIEEAYTSANTIALGAALVIAVVAGFAVTWYVAMSTPGLIVAHLASRLSVQSLVTV